MAKRILFDLQINTILDNSPTWKEYKDQKHDLFISDTSIAGYLTGKFYQDLVYYRISERNDDWERGDRGREAGRGEGERGKEKEGGGKRGGKRVRELERERERQRKREGEEGVG